MSIEIFKNKNGKKMKSNDAFNEVEKAITISNKDGIIFSGNEQLFSYDPIKSQYVWDYPEESIEEILNYCVQVEENIYGKHNETRYVLPNPIEFADSSDTIKAIALIEENGVKTPKLGQIDLKNITSVSLPNDYKVKELYDLDNFAELLGSKGTLTDIDVFNYNGEDFVVSSDERFSRNYTGVTTGDTISAATDVGFIYAKHTPNTTNATKTNSNPIKQ